MNRPTLLPSLLVFACLTVGCSQHNLQPSATGEAATEELVQETPTSAPPPPPCPQAEALEAESSRPLGLNSARLIEAARCLVRAEEFARAQSLLINIDFGVLAPYAGLVLGEAALRSGDVTAATAALRPLVFPEGPAQRSHRVLLGEALLAAGEYEGAEASLAKFLTGDWAKPGRRPEPGGASPSKARWLLSQVARARGDAEAEATILRRIWTHHPGAAEEKDVLARLEEIPGASPDLSLPDDQQLARQRVRTLERTYHWAEALALREQLPPPATEKERAAFARVVLKTKDYPRAYELLEALKSPGASELHNLAIAATRTQNYPRAMEVYRTIFRRFGGTGARPKNKTADLASYKIGYLAYDEGSHDKAISELGAHLKRYPRSRHAESARWFIAWSQFKRGDLDACLTALADLKKSHAGSSMVAAADYWTARIAGLRGDAKRERVGLEAVLANHPVSSYAWFAANRLGRSWSRTPAPPPKTHPKVDDSAGVQLARALAAAGLDAWARAELRALKAALGRGSDAQVEAYAAALSEAGAWAEARRLVKSRCRSPQDQASDPALSRLCWPRPFAESASAAAQQGGVSGHLPFAIMRAETGWKPWLTSPAGASGLMQIMPFLGEELMAKHYPDRHWNPLDLYDAELNAELGVHELTSLHARFDGTGVVPRAPLVIAGYNGGETAVRRWLGLYDGPPSADVFAEDVGYTETRRYVRKVLATMMAYRYVYGDAPAAP